MLNEKIIPNQMQQKAIDILKGPVMLLAGPGTGKTFTVINRIEKMLSEGIEPSSILCLTFSDAAATEMRQRLIKNMGIVASSVNVYTYHSFCNDIIKEYPSQFELAFGVKLINDTQKITLMKDCIDKANLEYFVPSRADKYYYTKNFISYIEKIKSKRITQNEYFNAIETNPTLKPRLKELQIEIQQREQAGNTKNKTRYSEIEKIEKNIEKAKELWSLYTLYTDKMLNNNLIDFSDMINLVLDAFENDKNFLQEVSNKYKYFLVDEYQDTNDLQNNIIFYLLEGNKENNIFVVGDDDQIIYGFQGAQLDNIEKFLTKFPQTNVICLKENNRSTQSILDFSYEVIKQDEKRLENNPKFSSMNITKNLIAKNNKIIAQDKKVRMLHFGENLQEINHIVDEIDTLIKSEKFPLNEKGEKDFSQIGIICKKRSELQVYEQLLKGKNILCQIDEGKSIFSIRSTILLYFYLKALNNHLSASDKLFGLMIAEPFKLDLEDYNKILHYQQLYKKDKPTDFISVMKELQNWKNPEIIQSFLKTFEDLKLYSANNSIRSTLIEILNRTGILEYFHSEQRNRMDNLMGIKKILSEAQDFESDDSTKNISDFVKYLDDCILNEIDITTDKNSSIQNAVQLTTFHGSKGREFEYVYLPNLISKNWEEFKMPGEYKLVTEEFLEPDIAQQTKDSELLKLLFVGITRAKHTLTLSFADFDDGKSQQITKYLANFSNYDFQTQTYEYNADDFTTEFVRYISRDVYDNQKAFREEIKERIVKCVLSPSRLNDYINCPRNFFYTKILAIDVEEGDWDSANFGTLIHSILENAIKTAKKDSSYPNIDYIKKEFFNGLENTRFTSLAKKEKFEKIGNNIIDNYYPHFSQIPINMVEDIEYSFSNVQVGENYITGKIDRIEKNSDGTYSLFDYKTGTPVSKAQISLGGLKEGYYNQLCFYKYAYEKLTKRKVSEVGIIYVEDHTKNVYKTFDDNDMQYIENKIIETYNNINAFKFDPIPQDPQGKCKFCAYKHLCKLDLF